MVEQSDLLVTIVLALAAASIGAVVAGFLRVSAVLGYIVAGLIIGPHSPGVVAEAPTVEDLADIGIALLMFSIGLQLSFGDLRKVGRIALIGGNIQVVITIAVGLGVGLALGWGWLESLFFGAVLSNSSSTVLSKVLIDRGDTNSLHSQIGLAWSTVQDVGTVVLVVILTTLADESGSGSDLAIELFKATGLAVLFLVLVVPVGLLLLPRFFERVSGLGGSEIFVLAAAGLALGIAFLGTAFGVSIALGAFIGGLLVGRSDLSHEVLSQLRPLRDIFAAVFFVSVGMLINLELVAENLHFVAVTLLLILVFKGGLSAAIARAFGYRARTAVLTGVILAQCAEFSFLMATVGTNVGAVSEAVFSVMLAASALSIVLAPAVFSAAQPLARWLEPRMPLPPLAEPPPEEEMEMPELTQHAIICGYGRVGRVIGEAFRQQAIPYVVIEQEAAVVKDLRDRGVFALQGSMSNPVLLERCRIGSARGLVVAIPDPISTRLVVEQARRANPDINIVVRTHSHAERLALEERGANEAVVGEFELALEMSRYVLDTFGVPADAAARLLAKIRTARRGSPKTPPQLPERSA